MRLAAMTTLLYSHEACLAHDTGPGHPDVPSRLRAVLAALEAERFASLRRRQAPPVPRQALERAHPAAHIDAVLASVPASGQRHLDGDTVVSPASGEAALRAAGALVAAVDALVAGEATNAFCAVRPPGHHAEPARAMGFCLFNAVALAALHARAAHALSRLAVIDLDVHHGNGTQAMFWDREGFFYASTHQSPLFPGTGRADERGRHNNILNAPLPPGSGSAAFRPAFLRLADALDAHRPELIFVSAGFDAHRLDPLAQLRLEVEDYAWATRHLVQLAALHAGARIVSVLEGGYRLDALAASAGAHIAALMAAAPATNLPPPTPGMP